MPSSHRSMSDETRAEISPHRRSLAGRFLGRWGGCSDPDPSGGHQGRGPSDFAGGPDVQTAGRTSGLPSSGCNPGGKLLSLQLEGDLKSGTLRDTFTALHLAGSGHLRLSAILESHPGKSRPNQPCAHPFTRAIVRGISFQRVIVQRGRMPRSLQRIPDYFTEEEAVALVDAAPSYPTRMAFRIMLKTGLRVSEALALRRLDLRLDQHPPIIVVAAGSPGNKGRRGREVPVPADLVESLRDLASSHSKNHYQPMLKSVAPADRPGDEGRGYREVGIDPARAHPHAFRHTYGRNCVLRGVPIPVLQKWLGHASMVDTQRYVELAGGAPRMGGQAVGHGMAEIQGDTPVGLHLCRLRGAPQMEIAKASKSASGKVGHTYTQTQIGTGKQKVS